jgi:hypothetical protein
MKESSVRFWGEQSTEENIRLLKKALPKKSIMVHFDDNPYFKEFLAHFFTASNFEHVKDLIYKLIDYRIDELENDIHPDIFYDDTNMHIKRSFFTSAIVTYSRCFNSPKGKMKKMDIKHLLKKLPADLMFNGKNLPDRLFTIHQKIITLRNKYIAHADDSSFETIKSFMTLNFNGETLEHSLNGIYLGTYNFDNEEMQDWALLTSFLIKNLIEKQKELSDLFFKSISKDELLKLAAEAEAFEKN